MSSHVWFSCCPLRVSEITSKELEDEGAAQDAGALHMLIDHVVPASLMDTMRWLQNSIGAAAAGLDALVGLFHWDSDTVSMGVSAGEP